MMADLFSGGGGGWCLAARSLGIPSVGIEWDAASCATRAVVGLATIRADVSQYPAERFAGKVEGLCGSPPCQSFSSAGKGAGLADPRGQMVYEPMRYVRAIRPQWVALEQVPEVLGYWRWIARELRTMGYSAWTGILNAADYGVPQIRKRAILLASLDQAVQPPAPTHSKSGAAQMFGPPLKPWVTMAEALGWGLTTRPAYTLCGASDGGGHHDGGSGQRRQIAKHKAEGRFLDRAQSRGGIHSIDDPSPTLGTTGNRWKLRTPGRSYTAEPRTADPLIEPAPTIALGHNASAWCWERPATTVQGDLRVAAAGHHEHNRDDTSIPVQAWELGVIQGFPADHPWQPPYVARQIGNAIPPPLALACLSAVTGRSAFEAVA